MSSRATGDLWWREFDPRGRWHALRPSPLRDVAPYAVSAECGEFCDDTDVEVAPSAALDRGHADDMMCGECLHAMGIL